MFKNEVATSKGLQASRRDILRTTAGVVVAGLAGGAMLHNQAGTAQAVERDLAASGGQGEAFSVRATGDSQGALYPFAGLGFHYQVGIPVDANTGQATGQRRHNQVVITKIWDGATPQLFQALVNGEIFQSVEIEFLAKGTIHQRILLHGARVVNLEQYMHFNAEGHEIGDDARQLEDVSFAFTGIEIENLTGKTYAADSIG